MNIFVKKYLNIFEYPNIRYTLTWTPQLRPHTIIKYSGNDILRSEFFWCTACWCSSRHYKSDCKSGYTAVCKPCSTKLRCCVQCVIPGEAIARHPGMPSWTQSSKSILDAGLYLLKSHTANIMNARWVTILTVVTISTIVVIIIIVTAHLFQANTIRFLDKTLATQHLTPQNDPQNDPKNYP